MPADRIQTWIDRCGWERILNTRGTTFKTLPENLQQDLDAAKAAALMREFPSVIKRPVVEAGKSILLVGFDAPAYEKALG